MYQKLLDLIFIFFYFIRKQENTSFFFFFQAEDGIRDATVTGVQTCALPICRGPRSADARRLRHLRSGGERRLDPGKGGTQDRKSTRLNSSHGSISYSVF